MAEFQDDDEENDRRIEAGERASDIWLLNNALRFWSACPNKRCRRARACVGDAAQCHAIFWPAVPEEAKVWWRAIFDARLKGRSVSQARRVANAAMNGWRTAAARRAAGARGGAEQIAMPTAAPRPNSPRLRSL